MNSSPITNLLKDMPVAGWLIIFDGSETIRLEFKHPYEPQQQNLYINKRHQRTLANNLRTAADQLEKSLNQEKAA